MRSIAALILPFFASACALFGGPPEVPAPLPPQTAWIIGQNGAALGQASFTEAPMGVLIRLEFSAGALPPGWHGLHLHGTGDCSDAAAGFQASGAHVGHGAAHQHGLLNPAGPEQGDLPNLFAPPSSPFAAEFFSTTVTLADAPTGTRTPLLDNDGAALVIHAGPDDHQTQPIGGAGGRLACAALTRLP